MIKGLRSKIIPCILFSASFLISGCGYHFGQGEGLTTRFTSINVPYVIGDQEGSLTSAIIREIVRSGLFEYQSYGGSLVLEVKQIDIYEENIGFRYDRKKRGALTKDVIPTEARIFLVVEILVREAASCTPILGPVRLSASVDYDHAYYSSRDGVNVFSLGQLSDLEAAYDAVQEPLHRAMAEKIVDYIGQSW